MRWYRAGWALLLLAGCADLSELSAGGGDAGSGDVASESSLPADSAAADSGRDATTADSIVAADVLTPPADSTGDVAPDGADSTTGGDASTGDATIADGAADGEPDDAGSDRDAPEVMPGFNAIGGDFNGLFTGNTVVLQLNGGETVSLVGGASGNTFTFPSPLPTGTAYTVTVITQPSTTPELCTVANGSGTAGASSATSLAVQCHTVDKIGTGEYLTCALLTGGAVDCWGDNAAGELGNGTYSASSTPVSVQGVSSATDIAVGTDHACALLSNGYVVCWGNNSYGQLGSNTPLFTSNTAAQVTGLPSAAKAIGAGNARTCAVLSDGAVMCWGASNLGNGTPVATGSTVPVQVSSPAGGDAGLTGAATVAVGNVHTCATLMDGGVDCWGTNGSGQLGNGTVSAALVPVPISLPSNSQLGAAIAVSAGDAHTCAVFAQGTVNSLLCWGANANGQLGIAGGAERTPSLVLLPSSQANSVSCGTQFTCAALANGSAACWGSNGNGQLGNDTTSNHTMPAEITGLASVSSIGAGYSQACAIAAGRPYCWGFDGFGQLGDAIVSEEDRPIAVSLGDGGATAITAGDNHTCAIVSGGQIECWGDNRQGQLGNGSAASYESSPVTVAGITTATQLAAGDSFTCALLQGGVVDCWGLDDDGQMGNGTTTNATAPTAVLAATDGGMTALSGARQIAAGGAGACALLADGGVDCWGLNNDGQIGNGTTTNATTAVPVDLPAATAVSVGEDHACAILSGGAVECWGHGASGQLGNGAFVAIETTPVPVIDVSGATALASGSAFECALSSAGVQCWGYDADDELGSPMPATGTPVTVQGITSLGGLGAGFYQACAAPSGGGLDCWGANKYGELGNGVSGLPGIPGPVQGLGGAVKAVLGGAWHTCALLADGGVDCWGWNGHGQLGNGIVIQQLSPVPVQ